MNPNRNIFNFSNIMSRRKQSHPKPLLKRDDEEYDGDENASTKITKQDESCTNDEENNKSPLREFSNDSEPESRPHSVKSGEKRPLEDDSPGDLSPVSMSKIIPTLRLNVALASDPASNPDAKEINVKGENYKHVDDDDDDEVDLIKNSEDAETLLDSVNISKIVLNDVVPKSKENVENLMAKNFDLIRPNVFMCTPCGIRFSSLSTLEAHATYYCSHRKAGENSLKGSTGSDTNGIEPPAKAMKTGKQYACSQCSYSADKKVSLNRHMRMHQTSPSPSSTTSNGDETPTQQIVVPQIIAPVSQPITVDRYCSDCDIRFSSTKTYRAHKQHYCSSRHQSQASPSVSSVLPNVTATPKPTKSGSQSPPSEEVKTPPVPSQPFLALPTNPIIIIPYSLIRSASIIPGPLSSIAQGTNSESACFILQNGTLQPIAYTLSQAPSNLNLQSQSQSPQTVAASSRSSIPVTSQANESKSSKPSSSSSVEVLKANNKRDGVTRETSTTPLDLSVRRISPINSNSARERSLSLSSAISDQFRMEFDTMMEGKENLSVSGDSVTPEQIVCAPSLPGSPPLTPSPKRRSNSPRGSTVSISPNSTSSHILMRPLLPADIALRLSDPSLSTLNVISPLVKQSMELAMRNAAVASTQQVSPLTSPSGTALSPTPTPIAPQVLVKTGMSKCKQCNIVFCKYENYVAHKKHYCSARNLDDNENGTKVSPPPPPVGTNSTTIAIPQTYQQLICVACGVKFASRDNLNAHQKFYCLKRNEMENQINSVQPKEKCAKCKTIHDPSQACLNINSGAYKCPICEVSSSSSAEARKHMETHGGIKAFRCTICRYKGNTLRGMRTHIRMHIDKKSGDFNEENYISCILEDSEIPPIAASNKTPPLVERPTSNCSEKINSPLAEDESMNENLQDNNQSIIKKEPNDDSLTKHDSEEDETLLIPENIIQVKMEEMPSESMSPPSEIPKKSPAKSHSFNSSPPASTDAHYCNNCDIFFTYENTLAAHKKFYCKGIKNERPASNGPSPNSNVSMAAETTVL